MLYKEKLGLTHAIIPPIHLHVVWRADTGVVANSVVTCPWTTDSGSFTFIHIYNPKRKWYVNIEFHSLEWSGTRGSIYMLIMEENIHRALCNPDKNVDVSFISVLSLC